MNILKRLLCRVPKVGDPVWFASKGFEAVVTQVGHATFQFQYGPVVREKKSGRMVLQYTTIGRIEDAVYDESMKTWLIGNGKYPKNVRGQVVRPDPIMLSILGKDGKALQPADRATILKVKVVR